MNCELVYFIYPNPASGRQQRRLSLWRLAKGPFPSQYCAHAPQAELAGREELAILFP